MRSKSIKKKILATTLAIVAVVAAGLFLGNSTGKVKAQAKAVRSSVAPEGAVEFPGVGGGAIPDGGVCYSPGAPVDITFNVSGIVGPIKDVDVLVNITHTYVGDLDIRLIAPDNTQLVLVSRTEVYTDGECAGDSSNLGGNYRFNDVGGGVNFWDAAFFDAADDEIVPNSTYRATQMGNMIPISQAPSPEVDITPVFANVDPNGTWILRVTDGTGEDVGTLNSATLTLLGQDVGPVKKQNHFDFYGLGMDNFGIVRDTTQMAGLSSQPSLFSARSYRERLEMMSKMPASGANQLGGGQPAPGNEIQWWVAPPPANNPKIAPFGIHTDFLAPGDYDGDGSADFALWRGIAPNGPGAAYFIILRSSDLTIQTVEFGWGGDDYTVIGDYDGDGITDPATFRCPISPGTCFFYYRGTNNNPNNNITYTPLGSGVPQTVFAIPGDFDGDGMADFCVQTDNPDNPGAGLFTIYRSSDLAVQYIPWGTSDDFVVPGDFDGDGMTDIAVLRSSGGGLVWWIREADGGVQVIAWGIDTDFAVPADYDGNGTTDIAVWRNGIYYVYNQSTNTAQFFPWGVAGDYPLANFQVK